MSDFRRPDLDLWEEEDDAEDARPTIVSERPSSAVAESMLHGIKQRAPIQPRPGQGASSLPAVDQEPLRPEIGRTALVKRLIAQGELDEALLQRDSAESLRDSDIAALRVPEPGSVRSPSSPAERVAAAPAGVAARPRARERRDDDGAGTVSDAEDFTEELVPTVAVKRPQPPGSTSSGPHVLLPLPAAGRDREVTERISVESPLASPLTRPRARFDTPPQGSLAPTAHTLRPNEGSPKAFPWWQTALAALALLGGGLGVSQLRKLAREPAEVSVATSESRRPEPEPRAKTEPLPAATAPVPDDLRSRAPGRASTPVAAQASAPAPVEPVVAVPSQPVATAPALAVARPIPARAPSGALRLSGQPPLPRKVSAPKPVVAESKLADGVAASAPAPAEPGPAQGLPDQELPSQPSRDQVTAALNAVVSELQKCVGDRHGTADLTLTLRSAGMISHAVVHGMYAGTPEGSCLALAVKTAKFPAFSDPSLRVTYPFQL